MFKAELKVDVDVDVDVCARPGVCIEANASKRDVIFSLFRAEENKSKTNDDEINPIFLFVLLVYKLTCHAEYEAD